MAETITRQLREPFVESAGLGITDRGLALLKDPIPTATYTGRQFVQGQSGLEQQAAAAAAGLDSLVGPDAYKQFMSPYQQEVIDTSLAAMDREQQKGIGALRQRAAQAGAFGGGREAAALGEYQATADIARAAQEAQLRQAGFQDARAAASADLAARQGLGQFQTAIGAGQRQLDQAKLRINWSTISISYRWIPSSNTSSINTSTKCYTTIIRIRYWWCRISRSIRI